MELSKEKSQEQADIIVMLAMNIQLLDVDYCKELVKQLREQANFEDSAAVLNRNYSPLKSRLIIKQASALQNLCEYVDALKEVDELKKELTSEKRMQNQLGNLFI